MTTTTGRTFNNYQVIMPDGTIVELKFKSSIRYGWVAVFRDHKDGNVWKKVPNIGLGRSPYAAYENARAEMIDE